MSTKSGKQPPKPNGRSEIDENLKRLYDDLIEDDVPDKFTDLLRRLREEDTQKGGRG